MTAQETIDKLNDALSKLVQAYKQLQNENDTLKKEIETLNSIKSDLEYKLSEYENVSEVQSNKISSMLNFVQSVISGSKEDTVPNSQQELKEEFSFDIKIDENKEEKKEDDLFNAQGNIDLNRIENLINN